MTAYPTRWQVPLPVDLVNDPDVFPKFAMQSFLVQKAPTFPVPIIRTTASGREIRASLGDYPTWKFKLHYDGLRQNTVQKELDRLVSFFASHIGAYAPFFFYDADDHTAANFVATGDGVTRAFQLMRVIAAGTANQFYEPIFAVLGNPVVTVNAVPTAVTVGPFGIITFAVAPANGTTIAWTGQFLFLCHFSESMVDPSKMVSQMWTLEGLPFTSWMPL